MTSVLPPPSAPTVAPSGSSTVVSSSSPLVIPEGTPSVPADRYPAIIELRKHAKLNGPALIDRVLTDFMRLWVEKSKQEETLL